MNTSLENFIVLDAVDSTNNYAMGLIHSGMAKPGTAILAMEQTKGKGQLNKEWLSEKGLNITMTSILEVEYLPVYKQFLISMMAALACVDFLILQGAEDLKIKWPNDIFLNDKKAGGILIENTISGNSLKYAAIGIGLNINQQIFPAGIRATSLCEATGRKYEIKELAKELHEHLLQSFNNLKKMDHQLLLTSYNSFLFGKDQTMKLRKNNITFETTIKGVSMDGQLQTFDSMQRNFTFNEVQWVFD